MAIKIERANERAYEVLAEHEDDIPLAQRRLILAQGLATSSEAWQASADGKIACVYGVIDSPKLEPARLWLFATPLVAQHKRVFARGSRDFVEHCLFRFGWLTAVPSNERSDRWLRWLGFAGNPLELRL